MKFRLANLGELFITSIISIYEKRLDRVYYQLKGYQPDLQDIVPISSTEYQQLNVIYSLIKETERFFDGIESHKLIKVKLRISEISKIYGDILEHFVDRDTLDETDYLTINKANKKALDEAIGSDDRVTFTPEEFKEYSDSI